MSPAEYVLGVDLDGVCTDFYGGLRPIAAEWLGVPVDSLTESVSYNLSEWKLGQIGAYEELHRWAVAERNLFRVLEPKPDVGPTLRRLSSRGIRIRIITHRLYVHYLHRTVIDQTAEWLERYGIPYWDLCFMKDKGGVGANLYIEDSPANIETLRSGGHPTIAFASPCNQTIAPPRADSWKDAERIVIDHFEKWQAGASQ